MFLLLLNVFTGTGFSTVEYPEVDLSEITETKKENLKQQFKTQVQDYIVSVAPKSKMSADSIVELCLRYDYDARLLLAQAHQEGHFATVGKPKKTHSAFGILAYRYDHPDESIEPYIKLMQNHYLKHDNVMTDLKKGLKRGKSRYAEHPEYEKELICKIKAIEKNYDIHDLQCAIKNLE